MAKKPDIFASLEEALERAFDGPASKLRQNVIAEARGVFEPELERLREALAAAEERAAAAAEKAAQPAFAPGDSPTDNLFASVASLYGAQAQSEILSALLDGVSKFTARAALFVVKGGNLVGWQGRSLDNVKGVNISGSNGLAERALSDKQAVSATAAEFDSKWIKQIGSPHDGNALVLPLVVRDKVAAVLYSDAGADASVAEDRSAVQVLVRAAASWLEIIALRKAAGSAPEGETQTEGAPAASAPAPMAAAAAAAAPAPAPSAEADLSSLSAEDQEIHKKAKRFARLLVDEIKLYNQAKVAEGRQKRDLYSRLKEDIDKSRATYDKRYGTTSASAGGYFVAEVVRILADNDPAVMGEDFKG